MNAAATGQIIMSSRELEGHILLIANGQKHLHGPFSKRPLADDGRAVIIFQCAAGDFAGRGGVLVDKHHHGNGELVAIIASRGNGRRIWRISPVSMCRNNHAVGEKFVADFGSSIKQAAGIATEIENQSARPLGFNLLAGIVQFF